MTQTISFQGRLVVMTCWCGIAHAVPEDLRDFQRRQHDTGRGDVRSIHCPLGHKHVPAGEPESERLRRSLAASRDKAARLAAERDQAEASRRATKGHLTRQRNRAKAGVCPCCNRTFKALARHMQSQHPEFDPAGGS